MASVITPYYREYELAWEGDTESSSRFRRILRILLILFLIFGILFPEAQAPASPCKTLPLRFFQS